MNILYQYTSRLLSWNNMEVPDFGYDYEFDEYDPEDGDIDWKQYKKDIYEIMNKFSIYNYSKDDFYVDSEKIIRNKIFGEDEFTGMLLFTLDIGYDRIWFYNDKLIDKSNFVQCMDGIWHKKDVVVNPFKYSKILFENTGFYDLLKQLDSK